MELSIKDLDKLISGCNHYRNVHKDLGNSEAAASWELLRLRAQDEKAEIEEYLREPTLLEQMDANLAKFEAIEESRSHPGYDDDCQL